MVTLKNGNTITGILSNQDGAEVECFTGTYEEGEFFISSNNVKAIEFGKLNGN
jgi:small nuclear ribonucleoprotein (snRNP)-like protein